MVRGSRGGYTRLMLRTLLTCIVLLTAAPAMAQGPVVFAASSLKTALDDVAVVWEMRGNPAPVLVYAGSSALARQIDQGAPADLVFTASADWMAWLKSRELIVPGSEIALLGNELVLIGPAGDAPLALDADAVAARLGTDRLAMALVDAVPAGQYGRAALEALGMWDRLAPSVAQTDNVRAALALVAREETPLGIVYATDALAEPRVSVLATFPEDSHPPIEILLALVQDTNRARAFYTFLQSPEARAIFVAQGFK